MAAVTKPTIKKEVEAAAIEHIKCPSCGAEPGNRCRKKDGSNALTHQRRKSAFISSEHCRFSTSRPIHVLKPEQSTRAGEIQATVDSIINECCGQTMDLADYKMLEQRIIAAMEHFSSVT